MRTGPARRRRSWQLRQGELRRVAGKAVAIIYRKIDAILRSAGNEEQEKTKPFSNVLRRFRIVVQVFDDFRRKPELILRVQNVGFPHGRNQIASMVGTTWAVVALAMETEPTDWAAM